MYTKGVTVETTILETRRLTLRPITMEDVPRFFAFFSDAETMRFYPATRSRAETVEFVRRQLHRYKADGYGPWAVILKAGNELIGYCGLINQTVDSKLEVEIGYLINREHWRKGYASEAAIGCRDYAFNKLQVERLISLIDPRNVASIGVARKVGMTLEKTSYWQGKWMNVYSLLKTVEKNTS